MTRCHDSIDYRICNQKTLTTGSLVSQLVRIGVSHYWEDMSVIVLLNQSVPPSHGIRKGVTDVCLFTTAPDVMLI